MVMIRLMVEFQHHHHVLPIGSLLSVPADTARRLVGAELAAMAEPERAIVEPEETRTEYPALRPRGRPRREERML